MVFGWFFDKKNNEFKKFKKELKKAEILDRILNNLLEDKSGYEKSIRRRIPTIVNRLKGHLEEFHNRLIEQDKKLKLYIKTSITKKNYLKKIEAIILRMEIILNTLTIDFHKDNYLTFIDETIKLRDELKNQIFLLEESMANFHKQSKNSLEWNYKGGTNNVDMGIFLSKVSDLGGIKIRQSGSHYIIKFKIYKSSISKSQTNEGEVAKGTLAKFVDYHTDTIKKYLDPKYLKCYFFKNNKLFEKIFVQKYKSVFKL